MSLMSHSREVPGPGGEGDDAETIASGYSVNNQLIAAAAGLGQARTCST